MRPISVFMYKLHLNQMKGGSDLFKSTPEPLILKRGQPGRRSRLLI